MPQAVRIVTRIQDQDDFSGVPADGQAVFYNAAGGYFEPVSAAQARTNLGLGTLATQSGTFSGGGTFASGGFTLTVPATGTTALLGAANVFTTLQTISAGDLHIEGGANTGIRWGSSGGGIQAKATGEAGFRDLAFTAHGTTANTLLFLDRSNQYVGVGMATPSAQLHVRETGSPTAVVTPVLIVAHASSGTPAAGYGAAIKIQGNSSTTADQDMARIAALWNVATHASRAADLVFYASDHAAEREGLRIRATGSAVLLIANLPTSDPGVSGALWNDGGTVKVSA